MLASTSVRPTRILFITATRLGDAVLSTGALDHLARQYQGARFTVACGPVAAGLFIRMPGLERLIVVDKRRFDLHWLALWRQVAGQVWDVVVDLRGSALSLVLLARRRAIMRGGRRRGHRLGHIAGALGLAELPMPVAWIGAEDHAKAAALLHGAGPLIGLGPTANWAGKVWPADRFVTLAGALKCRMPDARFAVFGGPGAAERACAGAVLGALPAAADLVGHLTLPEAAACLAACAVFVGNDSGLMHLAAATGTPTLGLFGPTPSDEYAPSGRCTAVALAEGLAGAAPMDRLTVDTVLRATLDLLVRDGRLAKVQA